MLDNSKKLILLSFIILSSFFITISAKALVCETNTMHAGLSCSSADGKSWNMGTATPAGCNVETTCLANPSYGTYAINCSTNVCDLTCDGSHTKCGGNCNTVTVTPTLPCNSYDSCNGYCNGCQGGYTMCNSTHVCRANIACLPGQTFNPCTNVCDGTASILKLGYDSVSGSSVIQSATYPTLFIPSTGKVGIGAISPNDILSLGAGGVAAPSGSDGTGHNFTNTYLSADKYALANYGLVETLISNATSTMPTLWSGTISGNIWNGNSGNVGIGTNVPRAKLDIWGNSNGGRVDSLVLSNSGANNNSATSIYMGYQEAGLGFYGARILQVGYPGITRSSDLLFQTHGGAADNLDTSWVTPLMIQRDTGFVGIGTTGPTQKLEVSGNIKASGGYFTNLFDSGLSNLIRNGSVENGTAYWGVMNDTGSNGTISAYTADSYSGSASLQYTISTRGGWGSVWYNPLYSYLPAPYFDTNKTYTLSFYAKSLSGSNASIGVSIMDGGATNSVTNCGAKTITTSWSQFTCTFTPSVSGTTPILYMNSSASLPMNLLFDSFVLTTGSQAFGASGLQIDRKDNAYFNSNLLIANNVGIGAISPNDKLSIGMAGVAAPAGSDSTGHNNTLTYLSADKYALANYGLVETLIANSGGGLWGGAVGSNIWSLNSGSVGIGTNSPTNKLQILSGTANTAGDSLTIATAQVTGPNWIMNGSSSNGTFLVSTNDTLGQDIGGSIGFAGRYSGTSQATWSAIKGAKEDGTSGTYGGYLAFGTRAHGTQISEKMRISGNGNVGIGTASPRVKLDVIDAINTSGAAPSLTATPNGEFIIGGTGTGLIGTMGIDAISGVAANMWIQPRNASSAAYYNLSLNPRGGNVIIGSNVDSGYRLDVTGDAHFNTSGGDRNGVYIGNGGMYSGNESGLYDAGGDYPLAVFDSANNLVHYGSIVIDPDYAKVGINAKPNDYLSISMGGVSAPAGSDGTGHNNTLTYLSTDNYALTNYGVVKTLIANATSTISTTAKFAGMSTYAYTGNNTGTNGNVTGYTKANAMCNATITGSHVCTSFEVLISINAGISMPVENVWIFNGPPGYTESANDCEGRTSAASTSYGTYWEAPKTAYPQGRGLLGNCNNAVKFACCK